MCVLTREPEIIWEKPPGVSMEKAWERLRRDIRMTLGTETGRNTTDAADVDTWNMAARNTDIPQGTEQRTSPQHGKPVRLYVRITDSLKEEEYVIRVSEEEIHVLAGDELGLIYAFLYLSEKFMGIVPFWYWNDCPPVIRSRIEIPVGEYRSPQYRIRYRGWFLNDEVLLDVWNVPESWEMAFEALLRLGGNMVIPGTDNNSKRFRTLAADMGLWITHHHAEPLGAEMFLRAYPEKTPSFAEHPELFRGLWKSAVDAQKGSRTIWNLGFRGQGDRPFWADDPQYDTPKMRGSLISSLIREQYDMVKASDPAAVCCTNLYGEAMELYRLGVLKLPEDCIYIWADNGYGRMVSRRQDAHNPRIPALPEKGAGGKHGIYYHASFYDLQAAFHITMLPNSPRMVTEQLEEAYERGAKEFLMVNASNVRPHTYTLHKIASEWGYCGEYMEQYYKDAAEKASVFYRDYYKAMLSFGSHEDEKAGEQFYHYAMRALCHGLMSDGGRTAERDLVWLTGSIPFGEQTELIGRLLDSGVSRLERYRLSCEAAKAGMPLLFGDTLWLQACIHAHSCLAGVYLCGAVRETLQGDYEAAFLSAGDAVCRLNRILSAMRETEHGKWKDFYANECLTDVKFTIYMIKGVMQYVRNLGDGPHFYSWARKYMGDRQDERVLLITNMRNHPEDWELYEGMKKRCGNGVCRSDI